MSKMLRFVSAILLMSCLCALSARAGSSTAYRAYANPSTSSTSAEIGQRPILLAYCGAMGGYESFEAQARAQEAQARADRASARRAKAEMQRQQRIQNKSDQTALKQLGYYSGSIDGRSGSSTRLAIREFQRMNGLPVNGSMSKWSRQLIIEGKAKNKDDVSRKDIASDQTALKQLGYYSGNINGISNTATRQAIRDFQRMNGLTVNGSMSKWSRQLIIDGKAKKKNG